jgi:hypothetical protein
MAVAYQDHGRLALHLHKTEDGRKRQQTVDDVAERRGFQSKDEMQPH